MLSAAARAFGTRALPFCRTTAPLSPFARGMSTSEPDTSVVDTCQEKIQAALDTDNVKVTGKLNVYCFIIFIVSVTVFWYSS